MTTCTQYLNILKNELRLLTCFVFWCCCRMEFTTRILVMESQREWNPKLYHLKRQEKKLWQMDWREPLSKLEKLTMVLLHLLSMNYIKLHFTLLSLIYDDNKCHEKKNQQWWTNPPPPTPNIYIHGCYLFWTCTFINLFRSLITRRYLTAVSLKIICTNKIKYFLLLVL